MTVKNIVVLGCRKIVTVYYLLKLSFHPYNSAIE